jgi:4-nitrophenyl phosphatase
LRYLKQHGIPFQLATNNSTRSVAEFAAKCAALGLPASAEQIINSPLVALDELRRQVKPGSPVYVIGSPSLEAFFAEAGFTLDSKRAKAVIVGLDRDLTYAKLQAAHARIMNGALFLATNADATLPTPEGLIPGAGSIVAALETATGKRAVVAGKPGPLMFTVAVARLGCAPAQALMIGDRLDTDIAGAQGAGLASALVLTGVSGRKDVGPITPDAIYETLADLQAAWTA